MLGWVFIFLIISIIAGVLGFTGMAVSSLFCQNIIFHFSSSFCNFSCDAFI